MNIKSINIFGITGGIGYSFFNEVSGKGINICGFYYKNNVLASQIKKEHNETLLQQVDLATNVNFLNITIPNYEGLLYAVGKSHFGNNLFDFTEEELRHHLNLNIYSLLVILKKLYSCKSTMLKKVVVVCSVYPSEINSLYHMIKRLQEELLGMLRYALNEKQIGLSIIKTGWVDTNMYKNYTKTTGKTSPRVISPNIVAKRCFHEFENNQLFNLVLLDN